MHDVMFVGDDANSKFVSHALNCNSKLGKNPPPIGSTLTVDDLDGEPYEKVRVVEWNYKVSRNNLDFCVVVLEIMLETR